MKKRLLSILTLLTMTVSLFSPVVLAQGNLNEDTDNQTETVEEVAQEEDIKDTELESSAAKDDELEKEAVVELEDLTIHDKDGNEIKKDDAMIMKDDEGIEIKAKGLANENYQWQILNPESTEEKDKWIDIQDETKETLNISYALIKSLLVADATKIRVQSADDKEHFSKSIKVNFKETDKLNDPEKESPSNTTSNLQNDSQSEENILTIEYEIKSSATQKPITNPYVVATLNNEELMDNPFRKDVKSPVITGYTPTKIEIPDGSNPDDIFDGGFNPDEADEIHFNIKKLSSDLTIKVIYEPADVGFTVRHYQQNIEDDKYALVDTEEISGVTGDFVNGELNDKEKPLAKDIEGFYSLNYPNEEIAADGKTVIDIYYDREYFLMSFDLQGGFGLEPIYAKYGAPIKTDDKKLQRPGYDFRGWKEKIPATMPAGDIIMKSVWDAEEVGYTVAYWRENANDERYTFVDAISAEDVTLKEHGTNAIVIINEYKQHNYNDSEYFTYNEEKTKEANKDVQVKADESTVVNIYYTRNTYTLSFNPGGVLGLRNIKIDNKEYHSREPYELKAKYEENIEDKWPSADNIESTKHPFNYKLDAWEHSGSRRQTSKVYTLTKGFIQSSQNNSTTEFTASWSRSVYEHKLLYYGTSANPDVYEDELLYEEKAYSSATSFGPKDITGFNKPKSGTTTTENGIKVNKFYYERKKYELEFHNIRPDDRSVTRPILYEQNVSDQYYEPENPPYNLDAGGYEFAGWYKTGELLDGDEFMFTEGTKMPAHDLNIYAKWTEKEHDVKFYNRQTEIGTGDSLKAYKVLHNAKLPKEGLPEAKPEDAGFEFIGWFYLDNGNEKAFDPENMAVTKRLNLYPKWRSNQLVDYKVRYIFIDEKDQEIEVAPSLTGQALAGSSKTFEPRFENNLYGEYRDGFYPDLASKALELRLDQDLNTLTFYYEKAEEVEYTVRYLDNNSQSLIKVDLSHPGRLFYRDSEGNYYYYKDGKKEYASSENSLKEYKKVAKTRKAVITEEFERITGYLPDSFYKRKVLSFNETENEIIFYYEQSAEEVPVIIKHFKQNADGEGYTEVESDRKEIIKSYNPENPETVSLSTERKKYSSYVFDRLTGFDGKELEIDKEVQITERGLELNYYYNRDTVNLTISKITDGQYSSNDKFLFNVKGDDINMTVTVSGNKEVTIKDLPAGEYTITEDTAWSWRYESVPNIVSKKIISDETIVFKNNLSKNKWLSDEKSKENIFDQRGGG